MPDELTRIRVTNAEPTDAEVVEVLSTGIVERLERCPHQGDLRLILDTGEVVVFGASADEVRVSGLYEVEG